MSKEDENLIKKELKAKVDKELTHLTHTQRQQWLEVLLRRCCAFSVDGRNMGTTHLAQHHIDTGTAKPFKQQLRQHPDAVVDVIDKEVKRMLDLGVIEPANSPYASNVLIVLSWRHPSLLV